MKCNENLQQKSTSSITSSLQASKKSHGQAMSNSLLPKLSNVWKKISWYLALKNAEQLQNTPQLIYMSLNKNSVYCVMPRSSKPPDTCKWGGPKLRGILKFSQKRYQNLTLSPIRSVPKGIKDSPWNSQTSSAEILTIFSHFRIASLPLFGSDTHKT